MRAAILTYHSLDDEPSVTSVAPQVFARHMESLHAAGIEVVPLERVAQDDPGAVAPRVAITFDDGFRNLLDHAVPVLQRLAYPATVFAVSDWRGKDSGWYSQPAGVPRRRLLDTTELKRMLDAGWQIGSHTRNHALLTELDDGELERELADSRTELERDLGVSVPTFAYPYGVADDRVRAAAARCFDLACGTRFAYLGAADDRHDLPRLDMYYFRHTPDLSHLFGVKGRAYVAMRAALRNARLRMAGTSP